MSIFTGSFQQHSDGLLPSAPPEHAPRGNPCCICGRSPTDHRIRTLREERAEVEFTKKQRKKDRKNLQGGRVKALLENPFLGIDGEGHGRNPHKYTLLACVDEEGEKRYIENLEGLSTVRCLDFLLSLPDDQYIFGYALGYDWTKILADIDNDSLYLLFRPELRARKQSSRAKGPRPVVWTPPGLPKGLCTYVLNMQGSKFIISRADKKIVIWDIFKFFQGKFVTALQDWKVGDEALWKRMSAMKDKRAEFTMDDAFDVRNYCLEECQCMAKLARKLLNAHTEAGLTLTSFYGAGSSAAAMLKKMGIKDQIVPPPDEMLMPVAQAFFGGRFENSVIGEIEGPVYNYDISSAYPYQTYFLPCLIHAKWTHTRKENRLVHSRQALVHYRLSQDPPIKDWAPFPFRDKDGNICYPFVSGGGWVWADEFRAARNAYPNNVQFVEAWVLDSLCDCHPFKDIAHYYRERCRIGKEGPGIVMKLGCNSVYGKIAQSVGNGVFNSWAWAGMITSGCRAQIIDMVALHKDRANCLMIATDGIFTKERLNTPRPKDTDSWATGKPLGGWEEKVINQNVFIARPGIYFPMNPSEKQLKEVKGRGVGKKVVYDNWALIADSWKKYGVEQEVKVANVSRFCGAKTSISRRVEANHPVGCSPGSQFMYHRADGSSGDEKPSYGEWVNREVKMSFNPMPKRECILEDGVHLKLRGQSELVSTIYAKAGPSQEIIELKQAMDEMSEQPDADLCEME
jgi:hypothetical protein